MFDLQQLINELGRRARAAARVLARASSEQKNRALHGMAAELLSGKEVILRENGRDIESANASGLSKSMIDRLTLNESRLSAMADGVRQVAGLPDPVGEVIKDWTRPNGLRITKVRV